MTPSIPEDQRKHKLRKITAGNYLLLSNDGTICWRISRYEETESGPVRIADWPRDEELWGIWKWPEPIDLGEDEVDVDSDRWVFCNHSASRRRDAIHAALEMGSE